ncbi:MAG: hypothetical protein M1840_001227 [Geoglossum simile]|nr:MAG: hypothetical protein M1840_001227 [Geoglossum simile]
MALHRILPQQALRLCSRTLRPHYQTLRLPKLDAGTRRISAAADGRIPHIIDELEAINRRMEATARKIDILRKYTDATIPDWELDDFMYEAEGPGHLPIPRQKADYGATTDTPKPLLTYHMTEGILRTLSDGDVDVISEKLGLPTEWSRAKKMYELVEHAEFENVIVRITHEEGDNSTTPK